MIEKQFRKRRAFLSQHVLGKGAPSFHRIAKSYFSTFESGRFLYAEIPLALEQRTP